MPTAPLRTGVRYAIPSRARLIVNADGYGFTPGVNEGIVAAFKGGLVTSTSCTPNFGYLADAGRVQRSYPHISFGVHFNLSVGHPVLPSEQVPSLVGDDGRFVGQHLLKRLLAGKVSRREIEHELTAQAAVLADQGVKITHWDGHQNKHLWPVYFEAAVAVAKRFGISGIRSHRRLLFGAAGPLPSATRLRYYATHPTRLATHAGGRLRTWQAERNGLAAADWLITPGYVDSSHKSMKAFWLVLATSLPDGLYEVYCHPGFPDELLRANAQYVDERAQEVEVLTSMETMGAFRNSHVQLINFAELAELRATA